MSETNCQNCGEFYWNDHICQDCRDKMLGIDRYKDKRLVSYLTGQRERRYGSSGGYCKNGHYNIIPASFEIAVDNKLYCSECSALICKVIEIEVTEREL